MELRNLKVGMYVRTKDGRISKLMQIKEDDELNLKFYCFEENIIYRNYEESELKQFLIKASDKLIDILEVGDYVNGMKVVAIDSDGRLYVPEDLGQPYDREFSNGVFYHTLLDMNTFKIKTILTKEQFDQMSYKVGE